MAKVKLSLRDLSVPQKVQFLRQVVTAMTGNANYATPSPTLASITSMPALWIFAESPADVFSTYEAS